MKRTSATFAERMSKLGLFEAAYDLSVDANAIASVCLDSAEALIDSVLALPRSPENDLLIYSLFNGDGFLGAIFSRDHYQREEYDDFADAIDMVTESVYGVEAHMEDYPLASGVEFVTESKEFLAEHARYFIEKITALRQQYIDVFDYI